MTENANPLDKAVEALQRASHQIAKLPHDKTDPSQIMKVVAAELELAIHWRELAKVQIEWAKHMTTTDGVDGSGVSKSDPFAGIPTVEMLKELRKRLQRSYEITPAQAKPCLRALDEFWGILQHQRIVPGA